MRGSPLADGVRFAETEQERRASYQLRYSIYVEAMGRLADKGDAVLKELRDDLDTVARAVIAVKDGVVVGTLRLFWGGDAAFDPVLIEGYRLTPFMALLAPQHIAIIERLMITPKHRGSAIALQLYKVVWDFALSHHIEAGFLGCEPHHLNAYLKLGFRPYAKPYSYPGIGLVIPMLFMPGDSAHLKQVGSPFSLLSVTDQYLHTEALLVLIQQTAAVVSETDSSPSVYLSTLYADEDFLRGDKPQLLDKLSAEEMERLLAKSVIIHCERGDRIIEAGNAAKSVFVVLSGYVEVRHRNGDLQVVLGPGDVMGEVAFLLNMPRTAHIIAASESVSVLCLDQPCLNRLLKYDTAMANKLLMNLCRCLCQRLVQSFDLLNG
jgi:hypothetical protein